MNKTLIKTCLVIAVISILVFACVMNLSDIVEFWNNFTNLLLPLIAGGILALFASVPLNSYKRLLCKMFKKTKFKPSNKTIHFLSFVLTLISIVLVLVFVLTLLIPEIVQSVQNLFNQIKNQIPIWCSTLYEYLDTLEFDTAWLKELIKGINIEKTIQQITDSINFLVPNVTAILKSAVNIIITIVFSIIIAIYITLSQEDISRQSRKVILAYINPKWSERILNFNYLFYQAFTKFLSGQCLEAIILGVLMFIAFSIFGLPYANLVGVLTAVCAIVPYIGAFASGAISVLLTALLNPTLALKCLIVYLVVQFVENQFIYPKVVGYSVDLPAIYILLSALIGAKFFGIIGVIFMIPLIAVIVKVVRADVHGKLGEED